MRMLVVLLDMLRFILSTLATFVVSFLFFSLLPYFVLVLIGKKMTIIPEIVTELVFEEDRGVFYEIARMAGAFPGIFLALIQLVFWYDYHGWSMFIPFCVFPMMYFLYEEIKLAIR